MLDVLAETEGNPPLYYGLLDGWMRVFGSSEAAVRSLSALLGTATIVVAYLIGRRVAGSQRIGLVLAALVAFNPLLVWFSQEARPYVLLVLLSGLSFLLFAEALRTPGGAPGAARGRVLAGWAVASGLALATHYFAFVLVVPEALWLLRRVRPLRPVLLAAGGLSLVPLALIPLVAAQGEVQDYSFVRGESLPVRVVAQVPKQWLVGYDVPVEAAVVAVAALLVAGALFLALRRGDAGELRALRLGAATGGAGLGIALLLALAGGDYYLSRYLLGAWLPLALVAAVGFGARRAGRAGLAGAAALCAVFVFVVLSVNARPELQRDDWRGISKALGTPDIHGRAIVVSPINGSIPLRLYRPKATPLPASGARVGELDAVAVAPRAAGDDRSAPPVPRITPPPGFREESRYRGRTFTVVRYRAASPVPIDATTVTPIALFGGKPDILIEPGSG